MYADLGPIVERAQLMLSELAELSQTGPLLRIVHRFQAPGTICLPGEEVWSISLINRGEEFRLPLSLALRLLLNHLAETRHIPQSAVQIAAGMRRSAFYVRHGANSGIISPRRVGRSSVKEYVKRLRLAFGIAVREARISVDPIRILLSQETMGNEVQYRLHARIQWVHIPGAD
jgi:hypothetical protein